MSYSTRPLQIFGLVGLGMGAAGVLLAELQARTYHESQDKPTYVIREVRDRTQETVGPRP